MIRGIKPRLYQETILNSCVKENCLVVLPTGLGKTLITLLLAAQRITNYPNTRIVFLSPTKPLVEQHFQTFLEHFEISAEKMVVLTGNISPSERAKIWKEKTIIFSTPQGLENDVLSGRVDFSSVSLLVFDEAHRAVGDYAYVYLAEQYQKQARHPRIIALTASPGSEKEKIMEVCNNLNISAVEIRTADDPDVNPYVHDTDIKWIEISLPEEFIAVKMHLEACHTDKIQGVRQRGFLNSASVSKTELLTLQRILFGKAAKEKDYEAMKAISLIAEALKVQHALELVETQGIQQLIKYMRQMQKEAETSNVKAVKNLVLDQNFRAALIKAESTREKGVEHPKFAELLKKVKCLSENGNKILIFSQYRDTASMIVEMLENNGISARLFVGQAKKGTTGLSQKKQAEMIQDFKSGAFSVMAATSVAEEGLDIPQVNAVIFYEPVPSAIRTIQRRGRTGRHDSGKVYVFMAKGTRDEGYRWSAHHKERRMIKTLKELRAGLQLLRQEKPLSSYDAPKKWKIYVDHRERGSPVIKALAKKGVQIELKQLISGDFLASERTGIEYKTQEDFLQSIIDGRLLEQARHLRASFMRPIFMVEGNDDIYSLRRVHPNAINGAVASITVDFGIPILYTRNSEETADYLTIIARREQEKGQFSIPAAGRTPKDLKSQQEHIIASFPGIGNALARPLLEKFGTIKDIINASEEDLKKVNLIGEKKARQFKRMIEKNYAED